MNEPIIAVEMTAGEWKDVLDALYDHPVFDVPWEFTERYVEAMTEIVNHIEGATA